MPVIVFFKTRESGCILIIETGMCSGITITCKHRGMNIKFGGLWFHLRYSCLLPVLETVYSYLLLTPCCWCLPAEFSAASSFMCPCALLDTPCPFVWWLFSEAPSLLANDSRSFLRAGAMESTLFLSSWCSVRAC